MQIQVTAPNPNPRSLSFRGSVASRASTQENAYVDKIPVTDVWDDLWSRTSLVDIAEPTLDPGMLKIDGSGRIQPIFLEHWMALQRACLLFPSVSGAPGCYGKTLLSAVTDQTSSFAVGTSSFVTGAVPPAFATGHCSSFGTILVHIGQQDSINPYQSACWIDTVNAQNGIPIVRNTFDIITLLQSESPHDALTSGCGTGTTWAGDPPPQSDLIEQITAIELSTELEPDAAKAARLAIAEARKFVAANIPHSRPLVMLSDDGMLSLQWRDKNKGVMIVFAGDGTATYSVKNPGEFYSTNAQEFSLSSGLPTVVREAIEAYQGL